jgi:hypothetical protein
MLSEIRGQGANYHFGVDPFKGISALTPNSGKDGARLKIRGGETGPGGDVGYSEPFIQYFARYMRPAAAKA